MQARTIQLNITTAPKVVPREKLKIERGPLPVEKPNDSYAALFRTMKVGDWVFCERESTAANAYHLNKCECRGKPMLFVTKRGKHKGRSGVFVMRKA
jgi:hypothetical protein